MSDALRAEVTRARAGEALEVVVVGASVAGMLAAAACLAAGARVRIIERDHLPDDARARPGVPQGRQPHVLLHRGLLAIEELLAGTRADLLARGAVPLDSGRFAWLGEYGWMPTTIPAFEVVSATRPLLEDAVRRRLRALPGLTIDEGLRVVMPNRVGGRWQVECDDGTAVDADLLIDASGRGSRLAHWLEGLGAAPREPYSVDARLGYACRTYRASSAAAIGTAVLIAATPQTGRGALAIPVEDGHWLVVAAGYGEHRPARDSEAFDAFLRSLADPAIAELTRRLEPVSDVATYRQTGNRRLRIDRRHWPDGLLVVGDAFCAFNPVYGQGMTIAACQALLLRNTLASTPATRRLDTRRLQRRLAAETDLAWSVATSEDLRQPSSSGHQTIRMRLTGRWSAELARQAAHGDRRAYLTFARVYHLMARPLLLLHPALVATAVRAAVRGRPDPMPRPPVLAVLTRGRDLTA